MRRLDQRCERLLQSSARARGVSLTARTTRHRPWASTLFVGSRLTIMIAGDDDARLDAWLIALPGIDLPLPGHFVADAEVIERSDRAATIELLLIEG